MANWGLTYERLREAKPDIIVASISAMGGGGPWKDYVGFAPTFHALSGLLSLMPPDGVRPMNLGHAYGDAVAGLYAALGILSALEHREHTGEGQHIDLSAYEAVCTLLGPEYMKSAANALPRAGKALRGDHRWAGPDGCYPCKGEDRWCVIAIDGEKEWEAFCRISRIPGLMSQRFSTPAGRSKNRAEMDALIGRWTIRHTAGDVARRLQWAGIAAASVQNARDLAKDRHLASRRFFTSLEHPSLGTIVSDRSALWPWRRNPKGWKAAPLLGEDNQYVFVRLLGMSDEEVRSLSEKGIIH
jgi:crotonobetainyl-CoA:carnitine CoA-transferase CaiB-like acyl-CoA transferase